MRKVIGRQTVIGRQGYIGRQILAVGIFVVGILAVGILAVLGAKGLWGIVRANTPTKSVHSAAVMTTAPGTTAAGSGTTSKSSVSQTTATVRTTTSAPPVTTTAPLVTTTIDPGAQPQTADLPSAGAPQFQSEMADLWSAVASGSPGVALPAFFPESAYAQLKGIADPQADWSERLVSEYDLSIAAAHALLGPGAAGARLVGVIVPTQYAHWVNPYVCYNRVGYYEVPNARVVYQLDGQTRSFGIASMISWRGQWYVVHMGAVLQPPGVGEVDDAETGPGVSQYSGTC